MSATEALPSRISVSTAALTLGVTESQVRILLRDGKIVGHRGAKSWTIDSTSVAAYLRLDLGRGRHWAPESSWALLHALDGRPLPPMPAMSAARLRQRIRQNTADIIAKNVAWRTSGVTFTCGRCPAVRDGLTLTGQSALAPSPPGSPVEGYFAHGDFDSFVDRHRLVKDPRGSLTIYLRHGIGPMDAGVAPPAVVAADLARSPDPAVHAAGVAQLEQIRQNWVRANPR